MFTSRLLRCTNQVFANKNLRLWMYHSQLLVCIIIVMNSSINGLLLKRLSKFNIYSVGFATGFQRDGHRNAGGWKKTNSFRDGADNSQDRYTQSRNSYKGDRGYGNGGMPRYGRTEEKKEPTYGYYDGDHVFGINSVRLAIGTGRRDMEELIMQEGMDLSNKKDSQSANEIVEIARQKGIPIREFSKHDLNMLSDNKPHQGFILRAKPLEFVKLSQLEKTEKFSCVLALDEVWDPQNFGALLRTSHFLQCDKVVVCSKNSAPLSPAVSRASAGALEVMTIYSTDNLMKFLDKSKENGWQVVGTDLNPKSVSLYDVPLDKPTILVLGNEGHGMRTNILRRCTHLVRIGEEAPSTVRSSISSSDTTSGSNDSGTMNSITDSSSNDIDMNTSEVEVTDSINVDSLNVSVTGAIILHHFLSTKK